MSARIDGFVLDEKGVGIANIHVRVYPPAAPGRFPNGISVSAGPVITYALKTDPHGHFTVPSHRGGQYDFMIEDLSYRGIPVLLGPSARLSVFTSTKYTVNLPFPGGLVTGETSNGVEHEVILSPDHQMERVLTSFDTDAGGHFSGWVQAGTYHITCDGDTKRIKVSAGKKLSLLFSPDYSR